MPMSDLHVLTSASHGLYFLHCDVSQKRRYAASVDTCVFEKNYRLQDIQLSKNQALDVCHPEPPKYGGEYRARTGDLLVANQALSRLS
jgi:hypothetical protein